LVKAVHGKGITVGARKNEGEKKKKYKGNRRGEEFNSREGEVLRAVLNRKYHWKAHLVGWDGVSPTDKRKRGEVGRNLGGGRARGVVRGR